MNVPVPLQHNPYDKALYDLLDVTGQMCWDENRDYGAKYGGGVYATAMHDMVKRDRSECHIRLCCRISVVCVRPLSRGCALC